MGTGVFGLGSKGSHSTGDEVETPEMHPQHTHQAKRVNHK